MRDDLRPVLESAWDADSIIIGSPIYYGNLTAPTLAFMNRLMFPVMYYENDPLTGKPKTFLKKEKKCGLIVTGNATEETIKSGYGKKFEDESWKMGWALGSGETLFSLDTYQFSDYSKYHAEMFDEKKKAEQRDKQFPIDLQNAYELGKRLAQ